MHLSISDVFYHGKTAQDEHVAKAGKCPQHEFLQEQRRDRQQDPESDRQDEEREYRVVVDETQGKCDGGEEVTAHFHERAEPLEEYLGRHGQPTEGAMAEHQALVDRNAFRKALVPPDALLLKHEPSLGHLGPARDARDESDAILPLLISRPAVQSHGKLHVLAHRIASIPTHGDHRLTIEQAECARYYKQGVARHPSQPPEQKGPHVFDRLDSGPEIGREPGLHHESAIVPQAAVHRHDRTTGRNGLGSLHEQFDRAPYTIGLEHRVGVDRAHEIVASEVDSGVQRVGLPTVLLIHHHEVSLASGAEDLPDRLGLEVASRVDLERNQIERLLQHVQGAIFRSVVDNDDL